MASVIPQVEAELEARIQDLGYELVEAEWAGSRNRPLLRIRIDHPEPEYGSGTVGVEDCTVVSRGLEAWLDELDVVPERYVLEVSTPGVERPLRRPRDFHRFAGNRVAVKGPGKLAGRATRLEGELLGLDEDTRGGGEIRLRLDDGEEVRIRREETTGAHLLFEW